MEPGTSITITCKRKHVLIGDMMTCQDNGTWSKQTVKCIRLSEFILYNIIVKGLLLAVCQ